MQIKHEDLYLCPDMSPSTTPFVEQQYTKCKFCRSWDMLSSLMRPCACTALAHELCFIQQLKTMFIHKTLGSAEKGQQINNYCKLCMHTYDFTIKTQFNCHMPTQENTERVACMKKNNVFICFLMIVTLIFGSCVPELSKFVILVQILIVISFIVIVLLQMGPACLSRKNVIAVKSYQKAGLK